MCNVKGFFGKLIIIMVTILYRLSFFASTINIALWDPTRKDCYATLT